MTLSLASRLLFTRSRISKSSVLYSRSKYLIGYNPHRGVQEFPGLRHDNAVPKDHVLILPEPINETGHTNELLRLPKFGEPETDYNKLNPEVVFRGLSQVICTFENFLIDKENQRDLENKSVSEVLKEIELNLAPLDFAFNLFMIASNVQPRLYNHLEFIELLRRYYKAREKRFEGIFKESLTNDSKVSLKKLDQADKKMLRIYEVIESSKRGLRPLDVTMEDYLRDNLQKDYQTFMRNIAFANQQFSHTVDDPDILAAVSSEFEDHQDLHHKERTPLQITVDTYQRFMQVCPDRFVRRMLHQTCIKRCSPKSTPAFNNIPLITNIRVMRRKIVDNIGYRSHVEYKLQDSMALTKQTIVDTLEMLNQENRPKLLDRLQELNDHAADNQFEDPSQLGIQEYDVEYWTNKYMYDIIIGDSKSNLRSYFPLNAVMSGINKFFEDQFNIKIKPQLDHSKNFWSNDVQLLQVERGNDPLGNIIFDPYQRENIKRTSDLFFARLRSRIPQVDVVPARFLSTSLTLDRARKQAYLDTADIMNLFYSFGLVIQRLLYNYKYYELNTYGALECDATDILPNLCVAHLLTNPKILQSCSDRGGSKPIDSELARRVLKAVTYFKPFKTWNELYMAHFDLECHTILNDTKKIADDIYSRYSPFQRDPDNYDFCTMDGIFVGPNDGTQYSSVWSRQVANYCLSQSLDESGKLNELKSREINGKLLDALFDPVELNTQKKLTSLFGQSFEPTKTSLGVL